MQTHEKQVGFLRMSSFLQNICFNVPLTSRAFVHLIIGSTALGTVTLQQVVLQSVTTSRQINLDVMKLFFIMDVFGNRHYSWMATKQL